MVVGRALAGRVAAYLDCNRVPNGPARVDCAGVCALPGEGAEYDCAGQCGGSKYVDSCNICGGPDLCIGNVTEREWPTRGHSFDADGNCPPSMSNDCHDHTGHEDII